MNLTEEVVEGRENYTGTKPFGIKIGGEKQTKKKQTA